MAIYNNWQMGDLRGGEGAEPGADCVFTEEGGRPFAVQGHWHVAATPGGHFPGA